MRRVIRCKAILLLLFSLFTVRAGSVPAKPNITFILSDDIAQGNLGCYGQKVIKTPRLDRMAAEGTRYTQGLQKAEGHKLICVS